MQALKVSIPDEIWKKFSERLKKEGVVEVIHRLFDYVIERLASRIDNIRTEDGRAISFYEEEREILTINVTRKDLRIYIHPPAYAFFDPESRFEVEKFRFWEGSFQKKSGRYRAMSFWISDVKYLSGAAEIIDSIPNKHPSK